MEKSKKKLKGKIRPNSTADWEAVKKDYLKGMESEEIVKKYNVNRNTLAVHITSGGWAAEKELVQVESNKKIIAQTAEKRTAEILNIKIDERKSALKALDRVNDFLQGELKVYELKLLTDCQAKIQLVLYRSYGIDSLNVNVSPGNFHEESLERLGDIQKSMEDKAVEIFQILNDAGAFKAFKLPIITDAEIIPIPNAPDVMAAPVMDEKTHEENEPDEPEAPELSNDPHLVPHFLRKKAAIG